MSWKEASMDNCVAERVLLSGSLTESFKWSTTGDAGRMNTTSSWLEFELHWCCRKWCVRELRRLIVRCRRGAVELSDKVGDAGWLGDPAVAMIIIIELKRIMNNNEHTILQSASNSGGSIHSSGTTHGNMAPNLAARLIHPGIDLPVNLEHKSSVKWLQFLLQYIRMRIKKWYLKHVLYILPCQKIVSCSTKIFGHCIEDLLNFLIRHVNVPHRNRLSNPARYQRLHE